MKSRSACATFTSIFLALLTFTPAVLADEVVSQVGEGLGDTTDPQGLATDLETGRLYVADRGNNRVDAFSSAGEFEFAFGWGVVDGKAELQRCGPVATPPTASCRKGLAGGGAGEFRALTDIAVDNDPLSPSHQAVYVLDGFRVQKFNPEGSFLLAWGGGVITGGASGVGDIASGSTTITNVQTSAKAFALGQMIESAGKIPAETRIVALGPGTITLSNPAVGSGVAASLSVPTGPGNVGVNEVDTLINLHANGAGSPNFVFTTPDPSPSSSEIGQIDPDANASELQKALEDLPNIGTGNVKVLSEKVVGEEHDYTVEFGGPRFSDTDVTLRAGSSAGNRDVLVIRNGAGAKEICTVAIALSCSSGIEGFGPGQLARRARLAVGPGGTVYVVDCILVGGEASGQCDNRLQKFDPSGAFVEELPLPQSQSQPNGIAVSADGDIYVSVREAIHKYDAAAKPIDQLPVGAEVGALTVDATGHLFAAESEVGGGLPVLTEYGLVDEVLRRFGYGVLQSRPEGLAPRSTVGLYTSEGNSVLSRSFPPPGPVLLAEPCKVKAGTLGSVKATLQTRINPEGKATSFHFEYSTSTETKQSPEIALPGPADFLLHEAATKIEGLKPETVYHCRVVAKNADSLAPVEGMEGTFKTEEGFKFGPAWTSSVGETSATVNVEGNPLGLAAKGEIEYVTDSNFLASGFTGALKSPPGEIDFGAGETMQLRSVSLSGLAPGTVYHWRLRIRNGTPPEGLVCPEQKLPPCAEYEHAFRTYLPPGDSGFDQRRYELVSPAEKNGAEVAVPGIAGGVFEESSIRIQAGATSGEAITYTSFTSFGEAEGAPATSQYLSKRTSAGWATGNISPFGFQANVIVPPFTGFTPDLAFGAFKVKQPAITADCPEGYEDFYLHESGSGKPRCLTPLPPNALSTVGCTFSYAGASTDGNRVFFASGNSYADAPQGQGFSLYEWSADKGLQLLSILPNQVLAQPAVNTSFGPKGENCQTGQKILRHAVSDDGSRALWTYAPVGKPSQLFVRVNGTETIQIDAVQTGGGKAGEGVFWAASADGSIVYFTDENRLISGSKSEPQEPDLYRYEFDKPIGSQLTNLTKGSVAGDVRGVIGASDDGSYIYFVAGAVLSADEENSAGLKALVGKDNLYVFHDDKISFIATLAPNDPNDSAGWTNQPKSLSARVSPDGRHLAFLSMEARTLASYDNTVASGEHCQYEPLFKELIGSPLCPQAFLYYADDGDADENGTLTCASCNPSGARPLGPTLLPGWTNVYEGPRYLSEDGSRFFFETYDALLRADESQKRDIYEFELPGQGTCAAQNPNFDALSGGCHFLVSSGRSTDESFLVDASSDGRDVFFATRAKLVGWDPSDNYDIYDYREGGGFPEPARQEICVSNDACLPPVPVGPTAPAPATPNLTGPGDAEPAKPKTKHKKNRHKKNQQKKKHHKKKNSGKRRAGR